MQHPTHFADGKVVIWEYNLALLGFLRDATHTVSASHGQEGGVKMNRRGLQMSLK